MKGNFPGMELGKLLGTRVSRGKSGSENSISKFLGDASERISGKNFSYNPIYVLSYGEDEGGEKMDERVGSTPLIREKISEEAFLNLFQKGGCSEAKLYEEKMIWTEQPPFTEIIGSIF